MVNFYKLDTNGPVKLKVCTTSDGKRFYATSVDNLPDGITCDGEVSASRREISFEKFQVSTIPIPGEPNECEFDIDLVNSQKPHVIKLYNDNSIPLIYKNLAIVFEEKSRISQVL